MDVVINQNAEGISPEHPLSGRFIYNILRTLSAGKPQGLAAVIACQHQIEQPSLLLSPVHWQASHNDAMVMAEGDALDLREDEAFAVFESLKNYLAPEGLEMTFHDSYHWLLHAEQLPEIQSITVYDMPGKAMLPILEQLDPALYWSKILTECQMLLAQEPVNIQRQGRGAAVINGAWIWGEGERSTAIKLRETTSRGLSAGSMNLSTSLDPADKPRDVGEENHLNLMAVGERSSRDIRVMVQEKYLQLAKTLFSQVELLDENSSLKKVKLLIIDNLEALGSDQLRQLEKYNRRLYFNNAIIEKKKTPWLKRLFAKGAV